MNAVEIKTYEKSKGPESVKITIYAVREGYSFGVSVMVKWQGFTVMLPGHYGGKVINSAYIFKTEHDALKGSVKYIKDVIRHDRNYTAQHKNVIDKLLPDTTESLFEGI
ncbi:MAG: hypothetical protein LBP37_04080 [Spirochaetaceae bacterium]|nr:hypothetical protein [Spirochaetaceae bacterium]